MTAQAQPAEPNQLLDLGAIDIIAKPYDRQTLTEQLRSKWVQRNNAH